MDAVIRRIAEKTLQIPTLEARNSDSLDFHEFAVWSIKEALEQAYAAGQGQAMSKGKKLAIIRKAIDDACPEMEYLERENMVRQWMPYSLDILNESLDAGYRYPDKKNPYLKG